MDWAVLVAGYDVRARERLVANELSSGAMRRQGAANYAAGVYEMHYSLTQRDAAAASATVAEARPLLTMEPDHSRMRPSP
jgi:hypothetical protein